MGLSKVGEIFLGKTKLYFAWNFFIESTIIGAYGGHNSAAISSLYKLDSEYYILSNPVPIRIYKKNILFKRDQIFRKDAHYSENNFLIIFMIFPTYCF